MERFTVVISQKNQKNRENYKISSENLKANDLEDFSARIAEFFIRTMNHFNYLESKGIKGIRDRKPKKTGLTNFHIERVGEDFEGEEDNPTILRLSIKDFGKFVENSTQKDVTNVVFESLRYMDEVGYLFEQQPVNNEEEEK